MQITDIQGYARQMYDQSGPEAIAVAAQKASSLEAEGNAEEAETWRKIERALIELRGPHQG